MQQTAEKVEAGGRVGVFGPQVDVRQTEGFLTGGDRLRVFPAHGEPDQFVHLLEHTRVLRHAVNLLQVGKPGRFSRSVRFWACLWMVRRARPSVAHFSMQVFQLAKGLSIPRMALPKDKALDLQGFPTQRFRGRIFAQGGVQACQAGKVDRIVRVILSPNSAPDFARLLVQRFRRRVVAHLPVQPRQAVEVDGIVGVVFPLDSAKDLPGLQIERLGGPIVAQMDVQVRQVVQDDRVAGVVLSEHPATDFSGLFRERSGVRILAHGLV